MPCDCIISYLASKRAYSEQPRQACRSKTTHLLKVGHLDLLIERRIADGGQATGPEKLLSKVSDYGFYNRGLPSSRGRHEAGQGCAYNTGLGGLYKNQLAIILTETDIICVSCNHAVQQSSGEDRRTSAPTRASFVEIMVEALYAMWTELRHIQREVIQTIVASFNTD